MASYSNDEQVIIIGAGIVGSSLAKRLSEKRVPVLLIDRNLSRKSLSGATGHAPGLVGQLSNVDTLTHLAKRSVIDYKTIPGAFTEVGGLELAMSARAVGVIDNRVMLAKKHGLKARKITRDEARRLAPSYVRDDVKAGLHFPHDGTVDAISIALHDRAVARTQGARLFEASVTGLTRDGRGMVVGVKTDKGEIRGAKVVVATGIWTRQLSKSLPVYAVSHPYSLSLHRTPRAPSPFVRWPEQHVYGRDHGLMDGIGTYDHEGHPIDPDELGADAYGPWDKSFDKLLARAYEVLPEHTSFIDSQPFNGMLTVTPDGIPFVGQVMEGLYCAVAVWVTHAGGSAELLAKLICGSRLSGQEKEMLGVLDPLRFDGEDQENLKQKALRAYSDILHTDKDALKGREAKL